MLKNYIESFSYGELISRDEKIELGRKELFDFPYPFYDETERVGFETRFIKHFYMREIGAEVIGLFKFRLEDYLNLNMPYWNDMFLTEKLEFPVFEDFSYTVGETQTNTTNNQIGTGVLKDGTRKNDTVVDKTESDIAKVLKNKTENVNSSKDSIMNETESKNGKTTGSKDENNFNRNVFSDTPQNDLKITAGADGTGVLGYASTIEENKDINKETSTGTQIDTNTKKQDSNVVDVGKTTGNETVDTTDSKTGKQTTGNNVVDHEKTDILTDKKEQESKNKDKVYTGKKGVSDYADLLKKYRSTFLRIESQIFREVNKEGLFMLIYGGR